MQQKQGQWNFRTMQSHKYTRQQAFKPNLSLFIRLFLSLLLNRYAFFRVWLYEIENHFLCKGGIMKNATKVSSDDGPRACMGVRVCVCTFCWCRCLCTNYKKIVWWLPMAVLQIHTVNSCLWAGNTHYCAHMPISAHHYSLPVQIQHVFAVSAVCEVPLGILFWCPWMVDMTV